MEKPLVLSDRIAPVNPLPASAQSDFEAGSIRPDRPASPRATVLGSAVRPGDKAVRLLDRVTRQWPSVVQAFVILGCLLFRVDPAYSAVVADPNNPSSPTSTEVSVSASGINIPVKFENLDRYNNSTGVTSVVGALNVAKLSVDAGPTPISVVSSTPITSYKIRPEARGIVGSVSGNTLTFSVPGPVNLMIEINDKKPLVLLATPQETETYTANSGSVRYFGPGIHNVGLLNAASGDVIYLAPGALLKGAINIIGVSNVKLIGRGLVDGKNHTQGTYNQPAIYVKDAKDVTISGVGVRNARGWQMLVYRSENVDISYVNPIGFYNNNDGIDLDNVAGVVVRNNMIIAGDDALGWHGMGSFNDPIGTIPDKPFVRVRAENNTTYTYPVGVAFRFGASFETNYVKDVLVKDTYALQWLSDALDVSPADYAAIRDLTIENFYGSGSGSAVVNGVNKSFGRVIAMTPRCEDWSNPYTVTTVNSVTTCNSNYVAGSVKGVRLKNIQSTIPGDIKKPTLQGFDSSHLVEGISFENVNVNGTVISGPSGVNLYGNTANITYSATVLPDNSSFAGVVDNDIAGYSSAGTWYSSALAGYGSSTSRYAAGTGATATWRPSLSASGYYNVYVYYPHNENNAASVSYAVNHADGVSNSTVNQKVLGGIWRQLGTFRFNQGNTGSVVLTSGLGITRADAVKFEAVDIRTFDGPGTSSTGVWSTTSFTAKAGDAVKSAGATGAGVVWTTAIPTTGRYTAYVWYPKAGDNPSAVDYVVSDGANPRTVAVDQSKFADQWRSLGIFNFTAGSTASVSIPNAPLGTKAASVFFELIP